MDLRELRQSANLRITDVAYHLGLTEGTIRNWEKGRSAITIRVDLVAKLCRLYACSIDELSTAMLESLAAVKRDRIENEDQ